jgi:hypothetical protein
VSFLERPGVDLVVCSADGRGCLACMLGSDSPSKTAAFVSCNNEDSLPCKGICGSSGLVSRTVGQCGELVPYFVLSSPVSGRWVPSDVFESELSLLGVAGPELRGDPVNVSCGKPFRSLPHTFATAKHREDLDATTPDIGEGPGVWET